MALPPAIAPNEPTGSPQCVVLPGPMGMGRLEADGRCVFSERHGSLREMRSPGASWAWFGSPFATARSYPSWSQEAMTARWNAASQARVFLCMPIAVQVCVPQTMVVADLHPMPHPGAKFSRFQRPHVSEQRVPAAHFPTNLPDELALQCPGSLARYARP